MDTKSFIAAYSSSRNGTDSFTRHWLVRSFVFSDGVRECADAGCHWLLDIIATEALPRFKRALAYEGYTQVTIEVIVKNDAAVIEMAAADNQPALWTRAIEYTDMPEGTWTFLLSGGEGDGLHKLILLTEY